MRRFTHALVTLLITFNTSFAEEPKPSDAPLNANDHTAAPNDANRQVDGDETKLIDASTDLYQTLSALESRDYLKETYGSVTPAAISASLAEPSDESKIAATIASFTGLVNIPQLRELDTAVWAKIKDEWQKNPRDKRYLALLRRLLAAKNLIIGKRQGDTLVDPVSGKAFDDGLDGFKEKFRAEYKKVQESNRIYEYNLQQAKAGNEQAIKYVRERNPRILMDYLSKEMRTNTDKANAGSLTKGQNYANDVIQALSHAQPNGSRVFDFNFGNGEEGRIAFGEKGQLEPSFAFEGTVAESSKKGGFANAKVAPKVFEKPPTNLYRPSARLAGDPEIRPRETVPSPDAEVAIATEASRLIIENKCAGCHDGGPEKDKFRFNGAKEIPMGDAAIKKWVTGKVFAEKVPKGGRMPPAEADQLDENEKSTLRKWLGLK